MCTKIRIFLIVNIVIFIFSCENTKEHSHAVPNTIINFSVNLLNIPELQTPLQPKYISAAEGKKVGYKGHGIYLIKINSKDFRAFDASCTFIENGENHTEIASHLLQKDNNPMLVYCPKCKSSFNLLNGNVQSGPAKESMKEYKTIIYNTDIRIYN